MLVSSKRRAGKGAAAFIAAAAMSACLAFPAIAFAEVSIDGTAINQGENAVGGGTATLANTVLDMVNVVASTMDIDQDLTVNFNGGNDIEDVVVRDSSEVMVNFAGENEVEDFQTVGDADLTINANGHNDFDGVYADDQSNVTINVTGENKFDAIIGHTDANITIRGTDCQKKDIVEIGNVGTGNLYVDRGNLTIDHMTINFDDTTDNEFGSSYGNVIVDTSKIEAEDDADTLIGAGGTMLIRESVIEIAGEVSSGGLMTINHSDVKVEKPDSADARPYRVYSYDDIKLVKEKNGEVRDGEIDGREVRYVDTDDNDGSDVDLKADGKPAYYKCSDDDDDSTKGMPKTGDATTGTTFALLAVAGACTALYAGRRRRDDMM